MPNYVGDAVMALPAVALLQEHGYALRLLGRPWLSSLCAGLPLPVSVHPRVLTAATAQLRTFGKGGDVLLFPQSFSSALECRLAGVRATGYRRDFRGWLLARGLPYDGTLHQAVAYWRLARAFVPDAQDLPPPAMLPAAAAADAAVTALLREHRIGNDFVLLSPLAGGHVAARSKNWPAFRELEDALHAEGIPTVFAPGPGEEANARTLLPRSACFEGLGLDHLVALCARSRLVVANDSGQGHVAAAAGARLVSLFGVTRPERVRPWSPRAEVLGDFGTWPSLAAVRAACLRILAEPSARCAR
jgi:heptosyltransferase-2